MGLADLLKNVGRAFTLTAALYNCGGDASGEENICDAYLRACPTDLDRDSSVNYFKDSCRIYCVGDWEKSEVRNIRTTSGFDNVREDCGFIACAVQTGFCYNEIPDNSQILACVDQNYPQ